MARGSPAARIRRTTSTRSRRRSRPGAFSGLRIEALPDASLPNKSLGRNGNGNFVLTGVEAEITAPSLPEQLLVDFTKAEADYEQKGYEVKFDRGRTPMRGRKAKAAARGRKGWAIDGNDPAKRLPRNAMFVAGTPVTVPPDATIIVRLKHESSSRDHNIGRFRLATTSLPPAAVKLEGGKIPDEIVAALAVGAGETHRRSNAARWRNFYRENTDNPAKRAEAAVDAAKKAVDDFKAGIPNVMVMRELPQPRERSS